MITLWQRFTRFANRVLWPNTITVKWRGILGVCSTDTCGLYMTQPRAGLLQIIAIECALTPNQITIMAEQFGYQLSETVTMTPFDDASAQRMGSKVFMAYNFRSTDSANLTLEDANIFGSSICAYDATGDAL